LKAHRILNVPRDGMIRAFNEAMAARGSVADPAQLLAAMRLQQFYDELVAFKAARRSRLRKLLVHPPLPRGVWFWGGVGRGKSFLMDCFFTTVPYTRKRRVHFHAFMAEVHQRLKRYRNEADPLARVAAQVGRETRLLCVDEFHVADIADAMILGRLVAALFAAGVILCVTSNYAPEGLYPNGLQRERLLPLIDLLSERLDVIKVDAGIDYRLRALELADVYLFPDAAAAGQQLLITFRRLAGGDGHARPIRVLDRDIPVLRRSPGIAWLDFTVLCGGPRSQNDYLELSHRFHTLFLTGVPKMSPEMAAEARRFTWLVDVLYEHRVKLLIAAACPAEELYTEGLQAAEFARAVSRLVEMRSHAYLESPHRPHDEEGGIGLAA
jgi:cell division protein ZapE